MKQYQRPGSLTRMLQIEEGVCFEMELNNQTRRFDVKGGVVADTVGMGKTAEIIALLLAQPLEAQYHSTKLGALVRKPGAPLSSVARRDYIAGGALEVRDHVRCVRAPASSQETRRRVRSASWSRASSTSATISTAFSPRSPGSNARHLRPLSSSTSATRRSCVQPQDPQRVYKTSRLTWREASGSALCSTCVTRARKVWCVTGTPSLRATSPSSACTSSSASRLGQFVIVNSPFMMKAR